MPTLDIKLDPTGFPIVWVQSINAYLQWLPITKIQFEFFLCAEPNAQLDARWYDDILKLNARISPHNIATNNYWGAFLSGILPSEVEQFVRWCGAGYAIPTLDEWRKAYTFLKTQPVEPKIILTTLKQSESLKLSDRAQQLLTRLEDVQQRVWREVDFNTPTQADQMFMRMGVLEWVESSELRNRWGGMGQTHQRFHGGFFTPDHGQPSRPNDPENMRLHHYGFRLLWRKPA